MAQNRLAGRIGPLFRMNLVLDSMELLGFSRSGQRGRGRQASADDLLHLVVQLCAHDIGICNVNSERALLTVLLGLGIDDDGALISPEGKVAATSSPIRVESGRLWLRRCSSAS